MEEERAKAVNVERARIPGEPTVEEWAVIKQAGEDAARRAHRVVKRDHYSRRSATARASTARLKEATHQGVLARVEAAAAKPGDMYAALLGDIGTTLARLVGHLFPKFANRARCCAGLVATARIADYQSNIDAIYHELEFYSSEQCKYRNGESASRRLEFGAEFRKLTDQLKQCTYT